MFWTKCWISLYWSEKKLLNIWNVTPSAEKICLNMGSPYGISPFSCPHPYPHPSCCLVLTLNPKVTGLRQCLHNDRSASKHSVKARRCLMEETDPSAVGGSQADWKQRRWQERVWGGTAVSFMVAQKCLEKQGSLYEHVFWSTGSSVCTHDSHWGFETEKNH